MDNGDGEIPLWQERHFGRVQEIRLLKAPADVAGKTVFSWGGDVVDVPNGWCIAT